MSNQLISHPDNVKVGQVWEDNDQRMHGRTLLVTEVGDRFIRMQDGGGRQRFYLRRRMRPTSTGFHLVKEAS